MRKEQVLQSPIAPEVREDARKVDDAVVVVLVKQQQLSSVSTRLGAMVWRGDLVRGYMCRCVRGFHVRYGRYLHGED